MAEDYWKDTIDEAFEDAGITATKEQRECVAGWVEGNHDNYGLAHGHECIPNPRDADVDRVTKQLEQMEAERDQMELNFKRNIAMRRGCDVSDVSIEEDGRAMIR